MRNFRPLIVGNWKMNGLATDLAHIERIASSIADIRADIILCPVAILLMNAARMSTGSRLLIGAQDCSAIQEGAFTGDISPKMIADSRGNYVIVGHSERRRHNICVSTKSKRSWTCLYLLMPDRKNASGRSQVAASSSSGVVD